MRDNSQGLVPQVVYEYTQCSGEEVVVSVFPLGVSGVL